MQRFQWRGVILLTIGLFCLSSTLLVIASVSPQRIEAGQVTPLGLVDVGVAFLVLMLGIVIYGKGIKLVNAPVWQNSYMLLTVLPALLLVLLWLSLDKIAWMDVLLLGLAWRLYFFSQTLPSAVALWNNASDG